jgi:hypothetical protein
LHLRSIWILHSSVVLILLSADTMNIWELWQSKKIGIVTRLGAGRSGTRISALTRGFSPLWNIETDSGTHPASY